MSDHRPRILCIGANEESRRVLEGLIEAGADVVGIVTLPKDSVGQGSDYADLHPICAARDIPCIDADDINAAPVIAAMRSLSPDYVFVLGWSQLLGREALAIPSGYVVGSHPSPLPHGRGRAPIPWSILTGQDRNAISLFQMVAGADAGPLLLQRWYDIPPAVDAERLYELNAGNLQAAFGELLERIGDGSVTPVPQEEAGATYRARRIPADGHIDFHRTREDVDRLVRAVTRPYPGAYTYYRDEPVIIMRSDLEGTPDYVGVPGQILQRRDGRLLVHAADGPLWLSDLRTADGRTQEPSGFTVGDTFGYRVEDELHRLRLEVAQLRARFEDG